MARQGNLYSVLALVDPEAGQGEEDEVEQLKPNPMTSSKKKRRKANNKKEAVQSIVPAPATPAASLSLSLTSLSLSSQESASTSTSALAPASTPTTTASCIKDAKIDLLANGDHSVNLNTGKLNSDAIEKPAAVLGGLLRWPLVWIDLEMTGLDLEKDRILEIACIITDGKLQKLVEGPDLIINQSEELLASMGEWCQTHHTANGLVEGVRSSKLTEKEAELEVLNFVRLHTENGTKQPLLAGNSVYVDLMFLRKYMPNLAALFPHVVVDVSSIKALCLRWFPRDAERAPAKKKSHRALEDIKESIAELKYMQKAIFKECKR